MPGAMSRQWSQTRGGESHVTQHRSSGRSGMILGVGEAYAQEMAPGPGFVEVTYMPAGAALFASKRQLAELRQLWIWDGRQLQSQSVLQHRGRARRDDRDYLGPSVRRSG